MKYKELVEEINETFGFDWEVEKTKETFKGTTGQYKALHELHLLNLLAEQGLEDEVICQADYIRRHIFSPADLTSCTKEELQNETQKILTFREVNDFYKETNKKYVKQLEGQYLGSEWYPFEEIDLNLYMKLHVTTECSKHLVHSYVLHRADGPIINDPDFQISHDIYAADDVHAFIEYMKLQKFEKTTVVCLYKLEDVGPYSYFVFVVLHKDGHVLAFTDKPYFATPGAKAHVRDPYKRFRDRWENSMFPVDLFSYLFDKKETTELALVGKDRYHKFAWKDVQRRSEIIFTLEFIKELMSTPWNLVDDEAPLLIQAEQHYNQLLLEGKGMIEFEDDDNRFSYFDEQHKARLEDIMNAMEPEERESKALVRYDVRTLTTHKLYDKSLLASPEEHARHAAWMALDIKRQSIQEDLLKSMGLEEKEVEVDSYSFKDGKYVKNETRKEMSTSHRDDVKKAYRKELGKLLTENIDRILEIVCQAPEIRMVTEAYEVKTFGSWREDDEDQYSSLQHFSSEITDPKARNSYGSWWNQIHIGAKFDYTEQKHDVCIFHERQRARNWVRIDIRHWKQLCWLLDCNQRDLPRYFRAYAAHNFCPYQGNSILDATNPLNDITDPCSSDHPNGLQLNVHICTSEYKKRRKKYKKAEQLLIDHTGKVLANSFGPGHKYYSGYTFTGWGEKY